jgi:Outer membrane protein beta-barrel domain
LQLNAGGLSLWHIKINSSNMRKTFFAIALVLLAAGSFAQQKGSTAFGLKAGVNLSDYRGEDADGTDMRMGIYAGLFVHFATGSNWAIQPELMISGEGSKNTAGEIKVSYTNLPIAIQYKTKSGLYLETGPQFGFRSAAKAEIGNTETDVTKSITSTNISWLGGAGFVTKSGFGINARYVYGLSNASEDASATFKTTNIQLGLSWAFGK